MELYVGYGQRELTPPMGVELSGYGYFLERRCDAVQDPLYARALAFRRQGDTQVLINCDLLGLGAWMVDAVRGALNQWYGLSAEQVLLLSIHTHTGPTTGGLPGCGELDPAYAATIPGRLIQAAVDALADLAPVEEMKSGAWPIEPIGYNRTEFEDLDTLARGVTISRKGKKPLALASYACHPVTYGRSTRVSADYPGAVVRGLEKMGYQGIFLNGICGDVDPVINRTAWGTGTPETMEGYAAQILAEYGRHLGPMSLSEPLSCALVDVDMPLAPWGAADIDGVVAHIQQETGEVYDGSGYAQAAENWRRRLLDALARGEGKVEHTQVQLMRLGRLLIVALPYEAFTALGERIRSAFPDYEVWVLGNANATTAYLPTRQALEQGFSYATIGSCIAYGRFPFDAAAPDILVEKTCQGIDAMLKG